MLWNYSELVNCTIFILFHVQFFGHILEHNFPMMVNLLLLGLFHSGHGDRDETILLLYHNEKKMNSQSNCQL